jgi:hypothetical protein
MSIFTESLSMSNDYNDDTAVLTDTDNGTDTVDTTQTTTVAPVQNTGATINLQVWDPKTQICDLPPRELIEATKLPVLLPGRNPGEGHELSALQAGVVFAYIEQQIKDPAEVTADNGLWSATDTYEHVVAILRRKFVKGRQMDWNIVQGIADESREATAHLGMTGPQMAMLYNAILPALSGERPHFDEVIWRNICSKSQEARNTLMNEILKLSSRGDVRLFMMKFNAMYGLPKGQRRSEAEGTGYVNATAVDTGGEEPF